MNDVVLHLIGNNITLSDAESVAIASLLELARSIALGAPDYVDRNGLRPDIHLPGGDWREIGSSNFPNWNRTMIENARSVSPFSGFDMPIWSRGEHFDPSIRSAFYDRIFAGDFDLGGFNDAMAAIGVQDRMRDMAGLLIESWARLTDGIPEQLRVKLRPTAGEMGIVHEGRILNPDVMNYQTRINALYAGGQIKRLEAIIAERGSVEYLEIGPGAANFCVALNDCLGGNLRAHLIDLPVVTANAAAYLVRAAGASAVAMVPPTSRKVEAQFICLANHLTPAYEQHLPKFDLIHNVISMNEMDKVQVEYYAQLIRRTMAPGGMFYLSGGYKVLDSHVDAREICDAAFPHSARYGSDFGGVHMIEPTSFYALKPVALQLEQ